MSLPVVSVCIPTFNGAAFLNDCLNSVRSQSFSDFEIVIVDDNSTDETVAIATRHAADDPRIQIFEYKTHSGLGGAGNYNRCIEHSRGEWIKFAFQDDLLAPRCLERMLDATNVENRFVACWRDFLFSPDAPHQVRDDYMVMPDLKSAFDEHNRVDPATFCHAVLARWQKNFIGEPTSMMIHRDCFERYGQFNPDIATFADMECWIRIGSHEGLSIVPEVLATFRVHEASMSGTIRQSHQYRRILEGVILLHEFAYNPMYVPLRSAARKLNPPRNFAREFAKQADWAKAEALAAYTDKTLPDTGPISQWNKLAVSFPRLNWTMHQVPYKIRRWLDKTVLWRFRSHEKS